MRGIRTAIILGAGASFCYEETKIKFPTQRDIVGKLFMGLETSSGEGAPTFITTSGMKHSFELGQYLRAKFNIPENATNEMAKLDFWTELQRRGYNLESLYAEIESDTEKDGEHLLNDFVQIIRSAVAEPNVERDQDIVCRYHKMICEALEPGDYIINFNWDSLMADALLYHSHYWFPSSGFGLQKVLPLLRPCQKRNDVSSLVQLFHIHGSMFLYELDADIKGRKNNDVLYIGPKTYSSIDVLVEMWGIKKIKTERGFQTQYNRQATEEDMIKSEKGYILFQDHWFKPLFVPPSKYKNEYKSWYSSIMRKIIHSLLPTTYQIIFAGYSFPDADINHLGKFFVKEIIDSGTKIKIIDPLNENKEYRSRVIKIFPQIDKIYFSINDFREFCQSLFDK
jgi:hypothetical protein